MKIIVQNLAIEYQDEGRGSILLFLHGWQDSLKSFDELANQLVSSGKRVIRLDLPGFGTSELPPVAWSLDDYVQFTADFINKIGVNPDVMVGHSFGGRVIIKGIASQKLNTKKIVLIGSAGIAKRKSLKGVALALVAKGGNVALSVPLLRAYKNKIRSKLYDQIGSDYHKTGPLKETFLKVINEDLSGAATNLKLPALLIWGENDTETPLSDGRRLTNIIAGSSLKVIPGTTHFVHQEEPEQVAKLINEFV